MTLLYLEEKFKGRSLLTLHDYTGEEIENILQVALKLKEQQKRGEPHRLLVGKTLGMIFQKHSTRTRVSFEVGMYQLGGYPLFLSSQDLQMGRGEPIEDTARVLGRYVDAIMIRTYRQSDLELLAEHSGIPVINGLTDLFHPCQVLADLLTIKEKKGKLAGLKLAYVSDGNNMAHSLMIGGAKVGMDVTIITPEGYEPLEEVVEMARKDAAEKGALIEVTNDPSAVKGTDVIYTDVWASMGQEHEQEERKKVFKPYQANSKLVSLAKKDAIVMHCLPAHRGEEITEEVLEGSQSVVFDEAENRLHAQKAVLALVM